MVQAEMEKQRRLLESLPATDIQPVGDPRTQQEFRAPPSPAYGAPQAKEASRPVSCLEVRDDGLTPNSHPYTNQAIFIRLH